MPGRPFSPMPQMLMRVRMLAFPHEASQIHHMTPCNRFETRPTKEKSTPPQAQPIPTHSKATGFWDPSLPDALSHPLHAFSPSRQVLKKVRYRVEEKFLFVFTPHVVLACPLLQAVKAIRRHRE